MELRYFFIQTLAFAFFATSLAEHFATPARAEVVFDQSFKFFKVRGKTSQQIFRDFQRKSPIKAKGELDATLGVAAIKLTPEVEYETLGSDCRVSDANVRADVVIHLPRWANYKKADKIAKLSWDKLFSDIKTHELMHAKIAKDHAERIEKKLRSLDSYKDCDALDASLRRISAKLLAKHDREQREFDETEYKRLFRNNP